MSVFFACKIFVLTLTHGYQTLGAKFYQTFLAKLLANLSIFQTYFMHYPQKTAFSTGTHLYFEINQSCLKLKNLKIQQKIIEGGIFKT